VTWTCISCIYLRISRTWTDRQTGRQAGRQTDTHTHTHTHTHMFIHKYIIHTHTHTHTLSLSLSLSLSLTHTHTTDLAFIAQTDALFVAEVTCLVKTLVVKTLVVKTLVVKTRTSRSLHRRTPFSWQKSRVSYHVASSDRYTWFSV